MRSHRLLQTMAFASVFLFSGCENTADVEPNLNSAIESNAKGATKTYYGPETTIGDGTAWVWVQTVQGKPITLAIEFTEEALVNLSEHEMYDVSLKLPGQAHATGYKTITMGWNPMGHEPEGVYSLPHFDFHFYMQTEGQINKIPAGVDEGAYVLANKHVLPDIYSFGPVPFAVPQMGVHWSDVTSPEFQPGGMFTRTFIYGSHQDRVTFLEPMVTLAHLLSLEVGESETIAVPSLLLYEDPGYYPQSYTITHTEHGTYVIALTDLEWHNRNR